MTLLGVTAFAVNGVPEVYRRCPNGVHEVFSATPVEDSALRRSAIGLTSQISATPVEDAALPGFLLRGGVQTDDSNQRHLSRIRLTARQKALCDLIQVLPRCLKSATPVEDSSS